MRDALLKYNRGAIKTDEKTRTLWRVTAVLAAELALLALIVSLTGGRALAMCLGCSGERVAAVQRQLGRLGLYNGEISGLYDLGTRRGVKNFQREHGLDPSGEANGRTAAVLGLSTANCECFGGETELLARYIQLRHGAYGLPGMLAFAQQTLEEQPSLAAIVGSEPRLWRELLAAEPTSQAYEAAFEALSER